MILGTAGHIDHGKTALVRALTGVDTDRLPEEKRRGITIDLGFAPLRLADGTQLGVVDVPGHEAFVRTMLAGASGIDLALLIIAADEGPMPQTREHLAILELLDVAEIVVALTKTDLVAADWLDLVSEDVRALLASTRYAGADVIPTSVVSAAGIDMLREAIAARAGRLRVDGRDAAERDLFRMPIDRAFSVKGTGTVVTGTVWSGNLGADGSTRILPHDATARVRGLENHGESVDRISPGMRAAVALAGVEPSAIGRGATLVADTAWEATLVLRATVRLLPNAPELRPRTRVRLHLATSEVGARVVAVGGPVQPDSTRTVRVVLDEPVVARGGDRFVLRSASPLATIGGGVITDANAPRRARPMPSAALSAAQRLELIVAESGTHGLLDASIPVRLGGSPTVVREVSRSASGIEQIGDRWYSTDVLAQTRERIVALVRAHRDSRPLEPGLPRQDARSRLRLESTLFDRLVANLTSSGKLESSGAELRLAGGAPALSDAHSKVLAELAGAIEAAGSEPPSVSELQARFGPQTLSLLRHLERDQRVVQVEQTRFYAPRAVRDLLQRLEAGMAGRGELAPTELREMLGFSRKFLIPFLEYCDKRGYTVRQGNGRVWRGVDRTERNQPLRS